MKLIKNISFLLFIALFVNACEEESNIEGCTNPDACNYNSDANVDDGSCTLEIDCWDGSSVCDQNDCPEEPDTTDDLLVGSWNWVGSYEAALDSEGQVIMDDTSTPDSLNTWVLTMNDDGSWSEVRLDEGYEMTDGGTWSSSDGIITLTFDEEDEDHDHGDEHHCEDFMTEAECAEHDECEWYAADNACEDAHDHGEDETPQVAYVLSDDSNTVTMTATFDVDSDDDYYSNGCEEITDEANCNEMDYYCSWNSDSGICENAMNPITSVTFEWTLERVE